MNDTNTSEDEEASQSEPYQPPNPVREGKSDWGIWPMLMGVAIVMLIAGVGASYALWSTVEQDVVSFDDIKRSPPYGQPDPGPEPMEEPVPDGVSPPELPSPF